MRMKLFETCILLLAVILPLVSSQSIEVSTIPKYVENVSATRLKTYFSYGVASYNGHVYFLDEKSTIRKVDSQTGLVSTVAGIAFQPGYNGDGILAHRAMINDAKCLTFDNVANLYVADSGNYLIRRIKLSNGFIDDIAGQSGVSGSADGSLLSSTFSDIRQISVTSNRNIYVADNDNIRIISQDTDSVTTLATPSYKPFGIALVNGDIIFSDLSNNCIVKYNSTFTVIAGTYSVNGGMANGDALVSLFNSPSYLYYKESTRELFISDSGNGRIRILNMQTNQVSTFIGGDSPIQNNQFTLNHPQQFSYDSFSDSFIVSDMDNGVIRRIDNQSNVEIIAGSLIEQTLYKNVVFSDIEEDSYFVNSENGIYKVKNGNFTLRYSSTTIKTFGIMKGETLVFTNGTGITILTSDNVIIENPSYSPSFLTSNGKGEMFFYDSLTFTINRITLAFEIYVVAGNGVSGSQTFYDSQEAIGVSLSPVLGMTSCPNDNAVYFLQNTNLVKWTLDGKLNDFQLLDFGIPNGILTCGYDGKILYTTPSLIADLSGMAIHGVSGGYKDGPVKFSTFRNINSIDISKISNSLIVSDNNGQVIRTISCGSGYLLQSFDGYTNCAVTCHGILSTNNSTCSGNGKCQSPNSCLCNNGWTGPSCEYPLCFDISGNQKSVCSSNGSCNSPGKCSCNSGFYGDECQFRICHANAVINGRVSVGGRLCEKINKYLI